MAIPTEWDLPEAIRIRLGDRVGRQRTIFEEGHLLLLLHRVPEAGSTDRQGVYFWRKPDGSWLSSNGGADGLAVLKQLLDEYDRAIDRLQVAQEEVEVAEGYYAVLQTALPLFRAAGNLHQALQTARLDTGHCRDVIVMRDRASDIDRAAELIYTDARHALDYAVARQTEEQARLGHELNRSTHRLNLLAALFLPLTAIGAALGMNLTHGLEHAPPILFWFILFISLGGGYAIHTATSSRVASSHPRRSKPGRITRDPKKRPARIDRN